MAMLKNIAIFFNMKEKINLLLLSPLQQFNVNEIEPNNMKIILEEK